MKKFNIKKIIKGLIILLIFYNSSFFAYIPLIIFKANLSNIKNPNILNVLLSTFASLVFFILILIVYWKDIVSEFKKYREKLMDNLNTGFNCWIAGLMIMMACNFFLAIVLNSGGANNENAVQELIKSFPIIMGIDVCLLAPFNEEFVFRKTFYDVFKNRYIFVFVSFLLFGLAHVSSMATSIVDWLYIIPYGALGGAFALAYSKTDSVFTSITFHIIHNTLLFFLSVIVL